MKNNPFKYFVFLMLSLLMVATTGCTEDDISMPAGQLPDETPMNSYAVEKLFLIRLLSVCTKVMEL